LGLIPNPDTQAMRPETHTYEPKDKEGAVVNAQHTEPRTIDPESQTLKPKT